MSDQERMVFDSAATKTPYRHEWRRLLVGLKGRMKERERDHPSTETRQVPRSLRSDEED